MTAGAAARIRPPAVAGTFYPADPAALAGAVDHHLADAATDGDRPAPKALIVPHAGHRYSGPVAGTAYARLAPARGTIRRVVLLGPAHRVALRGMAVPTVDGVRTPLGVVPVDESARRAVLGLPGVVLDDRPHDGEHSLEVHLPFLQRVLGDATDDGAAWSVLPVVVGDADAAEVAALLDRLWGGPETLVVVSTDLSHFHDHRTAQRLDAATVAAITANRLEDVGPRDACGARPLAGLLLTCRRRGLHPEALDVRTSADTAGAPARVVGYAALVVQEPAATGSDAPDAAGLTAEDRAVLLATARRALVDHLAGRPTAPDVEGAPAVLRRPGASFVTLRRADGGLRGCLGSMDARRSLLVDVATNAVAAATRDPRFAPVRPDEVDDLDVHVAVLSPLEALPATTWAELRDRVRPGVDGLLIEAGRHRGTFLPAVWEQLPTTERFLDHLWEKAGLEPRSWPTGLRAWRYQAVDVG